MEEGKKKTIMIVVIAVCLITAVVIGYKHTFAPTDTGIEAFRGQQTWVKCNNPDCGAEYEMDKAHYFERLEELALANPGMTQIPPLVCEKCGEESVYRAVKCAKCGKIFFYGSAGSSDFADRCDCGYSQIKENRRKAAEARRRGE